MKSMQPLRLRNHALFFTRAVAVVIVLAYLAVFLLAYQSTLGTTNLAFRASLQEDDNFRVSWIMPGGYAWDQGARHGMEIGSIDGIHVSSLGTGIASIEPENEAELLTSTGEVIYVRAPEDHIGNSPMKYSVWAAGGIFALLGAAVLLRRPDFHAARMFALASGLSAIGFAVAPGAGGPAPPWALATQFLSVVGIITVWTPLGLALLEEPTGPHRSTRLLMVFTAFSLCVAIAYGIAVLINSSIYNIVRPTFNLYFSFSVLGMVGLLVVRGTRQASPLSREQARICLWGMVGGILPVVSLTLIPETLGYDALVPAYVTVLFLMLIPAFFAYAILQHQLMGIRRLVHRGMVYGISTLALFMIINLILIAIVAPFTESDSDKNLYYLLLPIILVIGIILFAPLRRGIRLLIDRFFYQDAVDYRSALGIVPQYLLMSGSTAEIATVISQRLAQVLSLESTLIFLGHGPSQVKLAATVGEKARDISMRMRDQIEPYLKDPVSNDLVELRLESDSLIFTHLESSGHYLGYMILGPKSAGEVFMEEEKQLLATLIPIISLVFDKAELSDELRGLSQRLIKAEEKERARIAGDLHDGPLQKAAFLVSSIGSNLEDQRSYANQLVAELREICSSLRPAILGDLGLVPALEWLLDNSASRHDISPQIMLYNINEEDRFPPDIEDTLFRIAQEAINNTIKHAWATSLNLSLSREDGSVVLHVTDNGIGFKTTTRDKGKYGLPGMRERAIQVDGTLDIHSAPGLGTTVVVYIPI
ncbi:ATP-binding protein [Chloroflexota bacterium]